MELDKTVTVGDAAHITAASPNGPRYNHSLTSEARRGYNNGIWLCVTHARIVDQDKSRYPEDELRRWKADAEAEAQKKLGRPQVSSEGLSNATSNSPLGDRAIVEDYLVKYRKLLGQCRGYIVSQMIHLNNITDLASWRRAQVNGTLREIKRVCDSRGDLLANPETMALHGSAYKLASILKIKRLGPTQEEVRQGAAWDRWSAITHQLGRYGPQTNAQVDAWKQSFLTLLNASLTALASRARRVDEDVKKWMADGAGMVDGGGLDDQGRTS